MGECNYFVSLIDDYTWRVWVYFIKEESEVFTHFNTFNTLDEKQRGLHIQCVRSYGKDLYFSDELNAYVKKHGIQRQFM